MVTVAALAAIAAAMYFIPVRMMALLRKPLFPLLFPELPASEPLSLPLTPNGYTLLPGIG
jgi:hypothetical protein